MKKHYNWACLALAATFTFSSLALSGCHHKDTEETTETTENTEVTTTVNDEESEDTNPSDTTDESEWKDPDQVSSDIKRDYKTEALELAEKVGLTEEDLRGEYEYFIEFAECVDGNPALYDYEGYVYQLFPMVADQIEDEDKEYFLSQLSNLVIEEGDPGETASAYYAIANNYVLIGGWNFNMVEEVASLTVYHELVHFVDGAIDGVPSNVAVMNDGSIKITAELTEDEKADVKQYVEASCFVEGGAEHYAAKYYASSGINLAYGNPTMFIIGLEYILGTEKVDSLFFNSNTTYEVFKLFEEYGFTDDEIIKLINGLNQQLDGYNLNYNSSDMMNPQEALIRLYGEEIGTDYKEDLIFCEILARMADGEHFTNIAPYPCAFSREMIDSWKEIVAEEYGVEAGDISAMNYPDPIIIDGEVVFNTIYTVFYRNDFGRTEGGLFKFKYDFEKKELIEYECQTCDWVPGEVNDKFKNEKSSGAKDLIESLKVDNSAAHDQTVTGSMNNLQDQYKRAENIGSKYGVYIWFADLSPMGLLNKDKVATDPDKIDAALDDIETVLSLYPEDYFDQLLFEYYSGFAICLYDGGYDPYMRGSYNVNGDYYMIINLNVSNPTLNAFYGADTVRNMGFTNVNIAQTQLICDIWKCTEKFFTNYNSHFEEPTKGDESWKKVNQPYFTYVDATDDQIIDIIMGDHYSWDYFICREAVTFKVTDRTLLYEYVMLSVLTDSISDLNPECEAKVEEICDEIRHYFDTEDWPDTTSWESI